MMEEQNSPAASKLKLTKHHKVLIDPRGLLAFGVKNVSGLLSTRALIFDKRCLMEQHDGTLVTSEQPYECPPLLWCDCFNDARSGLLVAIHDLAAIGSDGCRFIAAVPPYKRRLKFKADSEVLVYLKAEDISTLTPILPTHAAMNLSAFIQQVISPFTKFHSLANYLLMQLPMYKDVGLQTAAQIKDWHTQPWPGRLALLEKKYNLAVKNAVAQASHG